MVSHKDDFGVDAPKDSVNPTTESSVDDGIFAELQRKFLGAQATYVPLSTEPIAVVEPAPVVVAEPEAVVVAEPKPEPAAPAFVIPQVVSQLLVMEQRDRAENVVASVPVTATVEPVVETVVVEAVVEPIVEVVAEPVVEPSVPEAPPLSPPPSP